VYKAEQIRQTAAGLKPKLGNSFKFGDFEILGGNIPRDLYHHNGQFKEGQRIYKSTEATFGAHGVGTKGVRTIY